ncbi:hypothetical protein, partial [Roseomonas chloroacetimidivorans]|uniref:hypothetical protein n=1 Tax=Roseomonas chloroacetimidivorans TaxID=1766656 RepID=UPI003C768C4A
MAAVVAAGIAATIATAVLTSTILIGRAGGRRRARAVLTRRLGRRCIAASDRPRPRCGQGRRRRARWHRGRLAGRRSWGRGGLLARRGGGSLGGTALLLRPAGGVGLLAAARLGGALSGLLGGTALLFRPARSLFGGGTHHQRLLLTLLALTLRLLTTHLLQHAQAVGLLALGQRAARGR